MEKNKLEKLKNPIGIAKKQLKNPKKGDVIFTN